MKRNNRLITASLLLISVLTLLPFFPAIAEVPDAFQNSELQREVYMPDGSGPFRYYAQNDPVWRKATYEGAGASKIRPFGDGGCNPTSLAMVVASLVPAERLNLLGMSAARGRTFTLCSCSVNKYYCHKHYKDASHIPSTLTTSEDFSAVLPLAFADFATGNNTSRRFYRLLGKRNGGNGGTAQTLFAPIAEIYGLSYRATRELGDALATLDRGGMVIALCSGRSQLFSGGNGHYVVICSYDEDYIYVMDPFIRDKYAKDRHGVIEPVEIGVKKVKHSNIRRIGFGNYSLFEPAPETYYASLPLLLNPYTPEYASTTYSGGLVAVDVSNPLFNTAFHS